jgi:YspA, cpYpsA-related SLOG family
MKTAIIGSRGITNYELLKQAAKGLTITAVISGGATGADQLAERYAQENNLPLLIIPPDWDTYGKSAGMMRNAEIVKTAEQMIALWDGQSKGTEGTIQMAKRAGKPVKVAKIAHESQMSLF